MSDSLAAAVARAAMTLPAAQVETLARALSRCSDVGQAAQRNVRAAVATSGFDAAAKRVLDEWHGSDLPGPALALALRAAAEAARREREAEQIEVVCTGPSVPRSAVRLTSVVVADVIRRAQERLLIVSFASYRVPSVIAAIRDVANNARVDIVLESVHESGGKLSHDAGAAFAELGEAVSVWHWPADRRPQLPNGSAVLHAKSIVADRRHALVTSANLTRYGAEHNIELGVLVNGGPVPGRIADVFAGMIEKGDLQLATP